MTTKSRRYADTKKTSKHLKSRGVHYEPHTLEQQRSDGTSLFPYYRLSNGRVVYDLDEIDALIKKQRTPGQLELNLN